MKTQSLFILALLCFIACQSYSADLPSREVIEQHFDPNVSVFGSWAAVKLPVSMGVIIWNPVQIFCGPED